MTVLGREPTGSCASVLISWQPLFGGSTTRHLQRAGKHAVLLSGEDKTGIIGSHFICRGKASVLIVERKIGSGQAAHGKVSILR